MRPRSGHFWILESASQRSFVADLLRVHPPVGGTFWFQIFIQAASPEPWSETISGNEEREVGWPVFGLPPSKNYHGERIRCDHTCICDAAGTLNSCPQTEPSALGPATHRSARARDGSQRWLPAPPRGGRGGSPCERPE